MFRRKQRGVPKMKKISAKQQQILDYISSYSLEHGYPPSVRERKAIWTLQLKKQVWMRSEIYVMILRKCANA